MFSPLQGLRLGRRAVLIGFVLSGATATAVGAASGHAPWQEPARPSIGAATTVVPVVDTTIEVAPVSTLPPVTEPSTAPLPTTDAAVEPATAEPAAIEPTVTEAVATEPAATEPAATEPAAAEPAATEPVVNEPPATVPAPAPPHSDNVVPATLSLECALAGDGQQGPVSCSWSGPTPAGFASFVLLRGDSDGKGRVPFRSSDANAGAFVDGSASAGSHSYVVVALDASDHPLAHSNMVLVQVAAA